LGVRARARDGVHPRWLNRGVAGIGVASFFSDVSHEVPTALLPALLTTTLGAPAAALGTVEGIADGIAGAAKLAGGALADDPARRRATAMGGYTATAILSALIGAAVAVWQVAILRSAAWFSRGLRTPSRNALLTDVVAPEAYGRAYGFERAMDNAGAIGGPLLALALLSLVGVRDAILLSVIPGLLATLAIFVAVRSARRLERHERPPLRIRIRPVLHGRLGRLLGAITAYELGNAAATLLILRATNLLSPGHGHDSAVKLAVLLYVGYNAAAMVTSVAAGHTTDRRGATAVLVTGAFALLAAYVGFALAGAGLAALAVLFVLAGTGKGAVETAQGAAVALLAPPELLGSAFGALATIQSFANLTASALAGALWTLVSPRTAFLYLAGWMAVSAAALVVARR
jgi:MFS family permease